MNRKLLFIDWLSANKLKKVTPIIFADLLEKVFLDYFNISIWDLSDYKRYNKLRNELYKNKKFKKNDKRTYKVFILNGRFYESFLKQEIVSNECKMHDKIGEDHRCIELNENVFAEDQNISAVCAFFDDKYLSDFFYKLFEYSKKENQELKLDIRSSIIGVNKSSEILRFYSNKAGNIKFFGKKRIFNMHELVLEEAFKYIDDIDIYFQTHKSEIEKELPDLKIAENNKTGMIASRIPWDKFETALLIETFWQIERREVDRQTAINNLSLSLRKKATNQGLRIDEKFRNINGISIQMGNIALSFFPVRSPLHRTAIFDEVATIYKTNREEFNRLLRIAHSFIDDVNESDLPSRESNSNTTCPENNEDNAIKLSNPSAEGESVTDYLKVITSIFPDGYSFNNPLKKRKFVREYNEINQKEFLDSDELYLKKIHQVGFVSEEKVYLTDIVSHEIRTAIKNYIDMNFANGNSIIYYSVVYSRFVDRLSNSFSEDMLIHYLQFEFDGVYQFEKLFISKKGEDVNLKQMLVNVFMNCGRPLDIEDVYEKMQTISHNAIDQVIKDRDFIVNNRGKSYFYKDSFIIENEELETIKKHIEETLSKKESMSGDELYDYIYKNLPEVIETNPGVTKLGYRNLLKIKFANYFTFNGDVISNVGDNVDVCKLFTDFCKIREKFSLSDLISFKSKINKSFIDWDAVLQNSIRVDKDSFVRRDLIAFDVNKIDAAINDYCVNEYISFNDIINFIEFPTIGFKWNNYVLESFLFVNSKKFKLLHSTFNMEEPIGGIVKADSNIINFDELVIRIIKDNTLFEQNKLYDYLLENKFIKRRRLNNIDVLIEKAKLEG